MLLKFIDLFLLTALLILSTASDFFTTSSLGADVTDLKEISSKFIDLFLVTKSTLSASNDWSIKGIDGLRKRPVTEARSFTDRALNVLLPDLIVGSFSGFIGLGDLCKALPGDGSCAMLLGLKLLRTVGVLSVFAGLGRFIGVEA